MITSCGSPTRDEALRGEPRGGGIDAPISSLRGAGPVTAARLAARGIGTARDLLLRLPRGYDDLRRVTPLGALAGAPDGAIVLVRGTVRRARRSPWGLLEVVVVGDDGATVRARWFRTRAAMAKSFVTGAAIALAGPLRTASDGTRELAHPRVVTTALAAGAGAGLGVRPRYAPVEGVPARVLERLYAAALGALDDAAPELLPPAARARLGLPPLGEALRRLHAPAEAGPGEAEIDQAEIDQAEIDQAEIGRARRRLALESLVVAQLAFLRRRSEIGPPAFPVPAAIAAPARARLDAELGFALTASQRGAVDEIAADLAGPRAMQRLLVGDVGTGKTAVAFAAAALVGAAGGATLMMVPTEALAEQQSRALGPLAARLGLGLATLTGATAATTRAAILKGAAAGRLGLVIGTQALLGAAAELPRLGLVIVDEQHRFGVAERARLGRRGSGTAPHLLAMSATPIPRSLALAVAGDLDASFLAERPPGRRPAAASLCAGADARAAAYARLAEAVAAGQQAFVVCPVREEARRPGALTAVAHHARLRRQLAPARVGLVHGALAAADREAALRAFAGGDIDVLVATTVVELGIDVPNATVMIVEEAERFGIAQLHQLRGRVGRGAVPGLCFLCPSPGTLTPEAEARLGLVAAVDDGFRLAEADLAQRGEGERFGTRQAGAPAIGLDDLAALAELTGVARAEAAAILAADPALARPEHQLLAGASAARALTVYAGEAG